MRHLLLAFLAVTSASAQTVTGTVRDIATGEALIGVAVRVEGLPIGAATGLDGRFRIADAPAGTHTLVASTVGFTTVAITGVVVGPDEAPDLSVAMALDPTTESVVLCCEGEPIVDRSPFSSRILFAPDLERLPVPR